MEASADADNIAWVRGLFHTLRPAMKPGVYVNFMSGDEQDAFLRLIENDGTAWLPLSHTMIHPTSSG